ncbi:MAG TPA: SNF2-related protein [Acidimicrobiales bacterium]
MELALDLTTLELLVAAEAAGEIADDDRAALEAERPRWAAMVHQLLVETEEALERVSQSDREERDQAVADLSEERDRLVRAWRRAHGLPEIDEDDLDVEDEEELDERATVPELQASWTQGTVVLWAGNRAAPPADADQLGSLLADTGAAAIDWAPRRREVKLPTGETAAAVEAPVGAALGWLVGLATGQIEGPIGPSARWLGDIAVWATETVAQGRMVPTLAPAANGNGNGNGRKQPAPGRNDRSSADHVVTWAAAAVDARRIRTLASRMPGAVAAVDASVPAERVCRAVLDAAVDAICRAGAARLVSPAVAPVARSYRDVAEAVMARLDGTPFRAAKQPAAQLAHELGLWAAEVRGRRRIGLVVELHPPHADGGWLVTVSATGVEAQPVPVHQALATASGKKVKSLEAELRRLERLLPALRRSGENRAQVIVDSDEAWDLMTDTGRVLVAAGFDVRVPVASVRRPSPRLQLRADHPTGLARVGAHELSRVRWSVLFDDADLDAAEIMRLANEARPLVQVKGRWVALDRADLDAAAKALAQHSQTRELSGAAIVRYAVGLEDNPFGGPVAVAGQGWAVDLVNEATGSPPAPEPAPEGFEGELRTYQAEAHGWLGFLDRAGLGGCLAMDMGLGKTPTMLAHILATREAGPTLVVAPPAVLGNWAVEARKFTPGLRVHVHHGADRAGAEELAKIAADTDVVMTTYATAVRDVEALAAIEWHRFVLDEAQAIKNPASETAQQLRRVAARSRLALTGTPVENSLGDLWSILDFTNPGLVGDRNDFIRRLSTDDDGSRRDAGEAALRALNGLLVFRRTKSEPEIAAELPDKIDELDHCGMTAEQIGLYQAILDDLLKSQLPDADDPSARKGHVLAAITALKQVCDHPAAYLGEEDDKPLEGRSGKLSRLEELVDGVFENGERMLIFTHFAKWGERLAAYLSERTGVHIACYHGGLSRGVRDRLVKEFQEGTGPGALVLSIKAGGSGLNLTAANHVVLYDRWWNPAVEDQARDRAWRIGQKNTVISHRLVCPGTIDERVEEVVAGKRRIADLVLPASSSLSDLGADQLRTALGLRPEAVLDVEEAPDGGDGDGTERAA